MLTVIGDYTIGLELEMFLVQAGKLVSARQHGFTHDGDNILAEFRGQPSCDIFQAGYSLRAMVEQGFIAANRKGMLLLYNDWYSKETEGYQTLVNQTLRKYQQTKSINWQNMYGLEPSKKNLLHHAAGLHISIKSEKTWYGKNDVTHKYAEPIDFVQIFRKIEKEFEKEITESERVKGFYELKEDGRVEYRSLPTSAFKPDFEKRLYRALIDD